MNQKMLLVFVAALFVLPGIPRAMPAISCHCFQNREFDPRRPAAADEYLLTTTFNSFQAMALGIDRKQIVRAKMSGQTSEDLWLRYWLAKESGQPAAAIQRQYRTAGSWLAMARRTVPAGVKHLSRPEGITSDRQLAEAVAVSEMIRVFGAEKATLADLQKKGATLKEMALSLFISAVTAVPARETFDRAHAEGMTWGLVAQSAGIAFSAVETKMKKLRTENRE